METIILNEQQQKIVDGALEDCKIIGNPGVGKTTIMIHKIMHLRRAGLISNGHNFLIVTFTNSARMEFVEKSKKMNEKNLFSLNNVMTIHKFAGRIYKRFGSSKECDVSTIINAATKTIEATTDSELSTFLRDLLVIIVDEAQDISFIQYNFLLQLKQKLGICLMLIGDPNQNIFQFQGGSDRFLLDFEANSYNLTINNRSAKEIVDFANYFRPNQILPAMVSSRKEKGSVEIYRLPEEKIMDTVIEMIHKLKVGREDVAIIGPVKKSRRCYNSYLNIGLSLFENLFNMYDIDYVIHYPTGGNEQNKKSKRQKGKINLHTVHSSKGDEFHTVFLLNFHFFTQGRRPTYEAYNQFMYLWWTGITRAKIRLVIIMDDSKDHWPILQLVPCELYSFFGTPIQEKNFEIEIPSESKKITIPNVLDELKNDSFFELEQLLEYNVQVEPFLEDHFPSGYENHHLLQNTLRSLFFFLRRPTDYIKRLRDKFSNTISIPQRLKKSCSKMLRYIGHTWRDLLTLDAVYQYKDQWEDETEREIFYFLTSQMRLSCSYTLQFENHLVFENDHMMNQLLDRLSSCVAREEVFRIIFYHCLYDYQMEHEKKYLWHKREALFREIYLESYFEHLDRIKINDISHILFPTSNVHITLRGQIDLLTSTNEIHGLIYQPVISKKLVFDLVLNALQLPKKNAKIFLWNLYDGKRHEIVYGRPDMSHLMAFLCRYTGQRCKNLKILFSIRKSQEGDILDRCFYEPVLDAEISGALLQQMADRPKFIGFNSRAIADLDTDQPTQNLWKTIVAADPGMRAKSLKKCGETVCGRSYDLGSCRKEVACMADMIRKMAMVEKNLV